MRGSLSLDFSFARVAEREDFVLYLLGASFCYACGASSPAFSEFGFKVTVMMVTFSINTSSKTDSVGLDVLQKAGEPFMFLQKVSST